MLFACHLYAICMSFVRQSHVVVCHYYTIRMSLICIRMPSVCHLHALVCHLYVTVMYSYVIRKSLVCTFRSPVCHASVFVGHLKLDESFPTSQFFMNCFSCPHHLDRNCNGGSILLYIREDIPSKLLPKERDLTEAFFC